MLSWNELISEALWRVGNQYLENIQQQCHVDGFQLTLYVMNLQGKILNWQCVV